MDFKVHCHIKGKNESISLLWCPVRGYLEQIKHLCVNIEAVWGIYNSSGLTNYKSIERRKNNTVQVQTMIKYSIHFLLTCNKHVAVYKTKGLEMHPWLGKQGPLTGVPCRMSHFRNANLPCHINSDFACRLYDAFMAQVEFKLHIVSVALFVGSLSNKSYIDFKKWSCLRVEFKGQGLSKSEIKRRRVLCELPSLE